MERTFADDSAARWVWLRRDGSLTELAWKAPFAIRTSLKMTMMLGHAYFANTVLCAMAAREPGGMPQH